MNSSSVFTSRPLRGLLVDDDTAFAEDASRLLEERLGYRGITIIMEHRASPEDSIRLLSGNGEPRPFDLVITDMRFPPVGKPDAPWSKHSQRGRDVMLAAQKAGVPVVFGFTRQGAELFREWHRRCLEIGVTLYQWEVLVSADEDSVTGEIARALRDSVASEARRNIVAVACDMSDAEGPAMLSFLRTLGLTPVLFDEITGWDVATGLPDEQKLAGLFRNVQTVVVLFSPRHRGQRRGGSPGADKLVRDSEPDSYVQVAAGMALSLNWSRTVLVRLKGVARSFALYRTCVELDGTESAQDELARRLKAAGCPVTPASSTPPKVVSGG
jgi:hypothetical protein